MLTGEANPAGLADEPRFAHDALGEPGVRWMVLLASVNAINGGADLAEVAADLVEACPDSIDEAHTQNGKVFGETILPYGAAESLRTPACEQARTAVNTWIRASGAFDAVIDFHAASRSSANPTKLRKE